MPRSILEIPSELREVLAEVTGGNAPWPLLIGGSVGVGKTCAALALCDHVDASRYWTLEGFCELLRDAQHGRAWQTRGTDRVQLYPHLIWDEVANTPLLVIDEIGCRERASDHVYTTLQKILDARMGRPSVLITNLPAAQLRTLFDDRIVSRLFCGTAIYLEGKDRRLAR